MTTDLIMRTTTTTTTTNMDVYNLCPPGLLRRGRACLALFDGLVSGSIASRVVYHVGDSSEQSNWDHRAERFDC